MLAVGSPALSDAPDILYTSKDFGSERPDLISPIRIDIARGSKTLAFVYSVLATPMLLVAALLLRQ